MKTKFLIPVLAIIFAVGMSFTTVELGSNASKDYYRLNNQWEEIPMIECGTGDLNCEVELSDGSVLQVYDTQSFAFPKDTDKTKPFKLNQNL